MSGWVGYIIASVVFLGLIALGIVLLKGKGSFLIAGFNTLPKQQKEKFDEKALCRFVGRLLIVIAFCMPLIFIGGAFDITWMITAGAILILAMVIGAAVYANTGNRFRK